MSQLRAQPGDRGDHRSARSIVLFGDSIAKGLGARGPAYGRLVADALNLRLVDLSESARQVTEWPKILPVDERPTISVIAHGVTEAIVRPTSDVLRWVPPRWRPLGWMDPRPYYSARRWRRMLQRCESALKWRVKVALIRTGRTERLTDLDMYEDAISRLIAHLQAGGSRVVVLGPPDLEERYFPGSAKSQREYEERARRAGGEFVSLAGQLNRWDHFCADRFHPNAAGHRRIAAILIAHLAPGDAAPTGESSPDGPCAGRVS